MVGGAGGQPVQGVDHFDDVIQLPLGQGQGEVPGDRRRQGGPGGGLAHPVVVGPDPLYQVPEPLDQHAPRQHIGQGGDVLAVAVGLVEGGGEAVGYQQGEVGVLAAEAGVGVGVAVDGDDALHVLRHHMTVGVHAEGPHLVSVLLGAVEELGLVDHVGDVLEDHCGELYPHADVDLVVGHGQAQFPALAGEPLRSGPAGGGDEVFGQEDLSVISVPAQGKFFSEARLVDILRPDLLQELSPGRRTDAVLRQIEVPGVVHMPVQIDKTVGNLKALFPITGQLPDRSGQVDLLPGFRSCDLDAVALREHRLPGFFIHQAPEGACLHKFLARLGLQAVEAREQQVHRLPRPASENNPFVIFRHTGDLRPLHQQHPEDPPVQRPVPAHAELFGVPDGSFLQELEQLRCAQTAEHVHVSAAQGQALGIDFAHVLFGRRL